jgi:hypothetical protein
MNRTPADRAILRWHKGQLRGGLAPRHRARTPGSRTELDPSRPTSRHDSVVDGPAVQAPDATIRACAWSSPDVVPPAEGGGGGAARRPGAAPAPAGALDLVEADQQRGLAWSGMAWIIGGGTVAARRRHRLGSNRPETGSTTSRNHRRGGSDTRACPKCPGATRGRKAIPLPCTPICPPGRVLIQEQRRCTAPELTPPDVEHMYKSAAQSTSRHSTMRPGGVPNP